MSDRRILGTLLPLLLCTGGAATAPPPTALDGLLPRLGRLALLYRDTALKFSCEETITVARRGRKAKHQFSYMYGHDETEGFIDRRFESGKTTKEGLPREADLDRLDLPALRNALLWVFVFRETRQPYHRYTLEGEETMLGRPTLVVRFDPVPPFRDDVNDWFGKAWIDRESSQLVRVEAWSPADQATLERMKREQARRGTGDYPVERIVTEYGVEKNGMRFPSRVEILKVEHRLAGGKQLGDESIYRVEQVYADYRFFSVRNSVEIGEILAGKPK